MKTREKTIISINAIINAPANKVWKLWTEPGHIVHWNNASGDWHTTRAENDLREGGRFLARMEAKDGSAGFDFTGKYTRVEEPDRLDYLLDDGRIVNISFIPEGNQTTVKEEFEAEGTNSIDLQRTGWQAILDNFKSYAEDLVKLKE